MSSNDKETQQPQTLSLEDAFNLLVNLARQSKLTYQEHSVVDKAIKTVHEALNGGAAAAPAEEPKIVQG